MGRRGIAIAPRSDGSSRRTPPDPSRVHGTIYGGLLRLYPPRFRRAYGPLMLQAFRDRLRDARATSRRAGVARFWAGILGDLARSAPRERVEAVSGFRLRDWAPIGSGGTNMFRFTVRRLLWSIPVLLGASIVVFLVVRATVDPLAGAALNPRVRAEDIARLRHAYGLDRPVAVQYWLWLTHFVRGDWGRSLLSNRPVYPDLRSALANTLVLGLVASAISLVVGVGIGLYSALRQYSLFDNIATGGAFLGLSMPTFWFALMLQIFFGIYLTNWLRLSEPIFFTAGLASPGSTGFDLVDRARHLVLPVMVLAVQEVAVYSRYMRASMLEVKDADYVRTARAKGMRERRVVAKHAVRNALIPVTTFAGISLGALAGGLIITEAIFQYPGMGNLFVKAMQRGDYLVVLPWLMVAVTFVIVLNLVADIAYAVLDPRVRYQ
jgi:ABC-type dipeptide/oligopeptide/nickel transport system permease component